MTPLRTLGFICAAAMVWLVQWHHANAQQQPSAAAVALGREIVELKGGINIYDTVVAGVIEHRKRLLLQANPTVERDLSEVAEKLQAEYAPRKAEVHQQIARAYASQFTEAELRQILAFYKTPLGKKLIEGEPKAIDEATKLVDQWAAKFADEVMARIRAEMKKKGHNLM